MRLRFVAVLAALSFLAGVAGAQSAPNWITEILMIRSSETTVVRHPIDKGRYYICWNDGSNRFGVWFRKGTLDTRFNLIAPGRRMMLSTMLSGMTGEWTASDEKLCFPQ